MIIKSGTTIEFDENKCDINHEKHNFCLGCMGDVVESMLYGKIATVISDEFMEKGEPRFQVMAEYQGVVIFAACTFRNDGDTIRVISLREASDSEEEEFYNELEETFG